MVSTTRVRHDRMSELDAADVIARWHDRELDALSDGELVEMAGRHMAHPRLAPADSFVLHAPLELMARAALLRGVDPATREQARQRIAWLVATYDAREAAELDGAGAASAAPEASAARLTAAVEDGDLDEVDRQVIALTTATSATELVACLADLVVHRLGAAGHGSIFLYHLPRLLAADPAAASMARGLLREVARHPDWTLTWMDRRDPTLAPTGDLFDRLLGTPAAGDPGSHFIYPTMSLVEREGLATDVLGSATVGLGVAGARRQLLRVSAAAMLQDDPAHAPYGWSHALTMPQAALGVAPVCADPARAIAVAATFVLGFRATLGTVTLDPSWRPAERPDLDVDTFLDDGPDAAAAAMWHSPDSERPAYVRRLVTWAARHHDAHLAKYTLACGDAARDDPDAARLFSAAAAYLAGWWRREEPGDDLFPAPA